MILINTIDENTYSEVGGYFEVQFVLTLKWFDPRVKFRNLKDEVSHNSFLPLEIESIWVPKLIFSNTKEKPRTVIDENVEMFVEKLGKSKGSSKTEIENVDYFDGKENPLFLKRFYNQKFLCDYKLSWYPFDVQHCYMVLEMEKSASPFTLLTLGTYEYEGERFLNQYMVRDVIAITRHKKGIQDIFVEIILGRQLLGVVLNIIIPTIVLNIISYSTNFYKEEYFETVIAINLTTMLVIVTLFVSVSHIR